ncbi:MAG: CidA/LrgA family protein [Gammaproteobacteria bacterium]|nr:CidA/LrgA family protein [Gammaproteobacteria bacterium]
MQFLNGLTILLAYQLAGEVITVFLGLPVPGPVLGMVLLFLTLLARKTTPAALDQASSALLSHLTLLFVPAGVGLMVHLDLIAAEWLPVLVALLLSTLISLAATSAIMLLCDRFFSDLGKRDD